MAATHLKQVGTIVTKVQFWQPHNSVIPDMFSSYSTHHPKLCGPAGCITVIHLPLTALFFSLQHSHFITLPPLSTSWARSTSNLLDLLSTWQIHAENLLPKRSTCFCYSCLFHSALVSIKADVTFCRSSWQLSEVSQKQAFLINNISFKLHCAGCGCCLYLQEGCSCWSLPASFYIVFSLNLIWHNLQVQYIS